MELNYEQAIGVLVEDSPNEEIDELKISFAEQVLAIEEAIESEDDGTMSAEEADAAIAQVIAETAQEQLDIFELEIEPVEMSAYPPDMASFSSGFASVLNNLIETEYQTFGDAIGRLSDLTGLEQDLIVGMTEGSVVPDLETANAMTSAFDILTNNDDAYKQWNDLASRAYGEAMHDGSERYYLGDENDLVEEEDEDEAESVVNNTYEYDRALASLSAENNRLQAEFGQMQTKQELEERLRVLEKQANSAVADGYLTPYERQLLLGSQDERQDTVALFSASCEQLGVPYETQLDRIKFYLHVASQRGDVSMFSQLSTEGYVEDEAVQAEDMQYAQEYFDRHGLA